MKTFFLYVGCILISYSLFAQGYFDDVRVKDTVNERKNIKSLLNERRLLEFRLMQLPSEEDLNIRLDSVNNRLIEMKGEDFLYKLEALTGGGDPY